MHLGPSKAMRAPNIRARMTIDLKGGLPMRSVPTFVAALALAMLAAPALAFDVQNGGASGNGSAHLAPDLGADAAGVSLDTDLRAQLGLPDDKTKSSSLGTLSKSGLQFGVSGGGSMGSNMTTMGYDERPWVAPRSRPGAN